MKDPEAAERVIRAIEEGLGAVREEARAQKEVVKAELKEELAKELVTKADLEAAVAKLRADFEARFVRLEIWLKVLAAIMLAGFTLFNPGFHKVVKVIIASIGA